MVNKGGTTTMRNVRSVESKAEKYAQLVGKFDVFFCGMQGAISIHKVEQNELL